MKKLLSIFVCAFLLLGGAAIVPTMAQTITLTVTNPSPSKTAFGALHDISRQATLAFTWNQTVIIRMQTMAEIDNIDQVKITVPKDGKRLIIRPVNGTTTAGFRYVGTASQSPHYSGVDIVSTAGGTSQVIIEDLLFESFICSTPAVARSVFEMIDLNNLSVTGCDFKNNDIGLQMDNVKNAVIKANTFSHDDTQLQWYQNAFGNTEGRGVGIWVNTGLNSGNVEVAKNTFFAGSSPQVGPTGTKLASTSVICKNLGTNSGYLNIYLNEIHFMDFGIYIENQSSNTGSRFRLFKNTISNSFNGVRFINSLPHWQMSSNTFINATIDLALLYNQPVSGAGFRLIDTQHPTSPTLYPAFNTNNTFSSTSPLATSIQVKNSVATSGWTIISGLDLNGNIEVVDGPATLIRGNVIRNALPIEHTTNGNNNIPAPNVSKALLNGNQLTVDYTLPGLFPGHEEYVVDVYRSNSQGHLLDYIGSQIINPLGSSGQAYQLTTTVASTISLTPGDFLAYTTTSSAVENNVALGTSMVTIAPIDDPFNDCNCISQFSPIQGEKYVLSAWVKVDNAREMLTYAGEASIVLEFGSSQGPFPSFSPSGPIIEGWQKIEAEFTVPALASNIRVQLKNLGTSNQDVFFDDIRVFPFEGNMKSFVYDPSTFQLVAELDENNHATFYGYDAEGKLVQVKKETVRGIQTISEGRSSRHLQP